MTLCLLLLTPELEAPLFVELESRKIIIGRSEEARICLPDASISIRHCSLRKRGQQYLLLDEGSARGTAIWEAGEWVWLSPNAPRVIQCGTIFRAGDISLQVIFKKRAREALDEKGKTDQIALDLIGAALSNLGATPAHSQVQTALAELLALPEPKAHAAIEHSEKPISQTPGSSVQKIEARKDTRKRFLGIFNRDHFWDAFLFLLILAGISALLAAWFLRQARP